MKEFDPTVFSNSLLENCGCIFGGISPEHGQHIGSHSHMFPGCASLENLDLSSWNIENVTKGSYDKSTNLQSLCGGCFNLKSLILPTSSMRHWLSYALAGCYKLKNITIPFPIDCLDYTFKGCYSIENINYNDFINKNNDIQSTFSGCYKLKSFSQNNIFSTTVYRYSFNSCFSIKNITIIVNTNITLKGTFGGCLSLTNLQIKPDDETRTYEISFSTDAITSCYKLHELDLSKFKITGFNESGNQYFGITKLKLSDTSYATIENSLSYHGKWIKNGTTYLLAEDDPSDGEVDWTKLSNNTTTIIKTDIISTTRTNNVVIPATYGPKLNSNMTTGLFGNNVNVTDYNMNKPEQTDNLRKINTVYLRDMSKMFENNKSLTELVVPFISPNVITVAEMFSGCTKLINLRFLNLILEKGVDTTDMFKGCDNLQFISCHKCTYEIIKKELPTNINGVKYYWTPINNYNYPEIDIEYDDEECCEFSYWSFARVKI